MNMIRQHLQDQKKLGDFTSSDFRIREDFGNKNSEKRIKNY